MSRKPIHEIRRGLLVARIGRTNTRSGTRHTVVLVRLFKNGDSWKESSRFGRDDLPVIRLMLEEAYDWISKNSPRRKPSK